MADTLTRAARPGPARGRLGAASWIQRRDRRGVWFVVPFLLGFLLFMLVPLGYAVYTSLYTYRIIGGTSFTGAANYTQTLLAIGWPGDDRAPDRAGAHADSA
jgi:multiple sugar transport system permease protein